MKYSKLIKGYWFYPGKVYITEFKPLQSLYSISFNRANSERLFKDRWREYFKRKTK